MDGWEGWPDQNVAVAFVGGELVQIVELEVTDTELPCRSQVSCGRMRRVV